MINDNVIHRATADDLTHLSLLFDAYRIFYEKQSDPAGADQFLRDRLTNNESVIFVSHDNDRLTGFVQLYPIFSSTRMARAWLLNDLFVEKKFRGRGYSTALMRRAQAYCIETNAAGMMLETAITNVTANALYHSVGFVKDVEHNFYWWEDNCKV